MKLNHDCVRSILLELEERLTLNGHVYLADLENYDTFQNYDKDTAIYAILKLIDAGFIDGSAMHADNHIYNLGISSITWDGHLFLDNIRDNKIWAQTKETVKKLSSVSLTLMAKVSAELIKKQFGLS